MSEILDGQSLAKKVRAEIAAKVKGYLDNGQRPPKLVVLLIGENPASQIYVKSKIRACVEAGIISNSVNLPNDIEEDRVLSEIERLNRDPDVDGILIQMPLPLHIDTSKIMESVQPDKDVDGFHPLNMGRLLSGLDTFAPCTPLGIVALLKHYKVHLSGKQAVIVGRSQIVGKPLALLLLKENCTVTIAHSKTSNLSEVTKKADILIAAMGKPAFITEEYLPAGGVVIDVGINRISDLNWIIANIGKDSKKSVECREKGYCLIGDVHPVHVEKIASYFTPVPGGVGPLTIAFLLQNTLRAYNLHYKI